MAIFAKIKGKTQGDITGGVTARGHSGEIEIQSCEIGISSPHDVASGMPSGKRIWRPVHLVKPLDRSTALLFNAIVNNEVLSTVTITYWRTGLDGKESNFVKIVLTDAMIADYNEVASADGTGLEKLTLTFTKFEFNWLQDGALTASDDWMATS